MSDEVLTRILGRDARTSEEPGLRELDEPESSGAFGWLRGVRDRAIMLELRKSNGNVLALGYSWLERAELDPSAGITLHFVGQTVRIAGRNLNGEVAPRMRLFEGITRHRVVWVKETDGLQAPCVAASVCVVDRIEW